MVGISKLLKFVFVTTLLLILSGQGAALAQTWKTKPFSVAVFNNATLSFPKSIGAAFKGPIHPGIELNYEFGWFETIKSPIFRNINTYALGGKQVFTGKWFQNVGLAYYYHQNINHAFAYTTKGGYRRYFGKFSAEAAIHAGMLHTLPLTERSVQQNDGSWQPDRGLGRIYLITGVGVGVGYDAGYRYNIRRVFINYDYRVQLPFSDGYAKYLPNGLLSIGIQFTLFKNNDQQINIKQDRLECPE